jgi:hypothetical protein
MSIKDKKIHIGFEQPNQSGIALVETIAALGLAIVVITSLVSLSIFTLRTSTKGKLLLEASKVASDQVEIVRAYRDDPSRTWAAFITDIGSCNSGSPCYMNADIAAVPPALSVNPGKGDILDSNSNVVSQYWFEVADVVSEPGDNLGVVEVTDPVVQIKVTVSWKSGVQDKTTSIYTDISNWRNE